MSIGEPHSSILQTNHRLSFSGTTLEGTTTTTKLDRKVKLALRLLRSISDSQGADILATGEAKTEEATDAYKPRLRRRPY